MDDSAFFERRLTGLFDRQRFFQNPKLESLIAETERRCLSVHALADEELDLVSAAGEVQKIKIVIADDTPDWERNGP